MCANDSIRWECRLVNAPMISDTDIVQLLQSFTSMLPDLKISCMLTLAVVSMIISLLSPLPVGGFCEPEQIGEYYWPETVVGDVAELPCFNGSALRLCMGASEWGPPLTDQCDDGIACLRDGRNITFSCSLLPFLPPSFPPSLPPSLKNYF